MFWGLPATTVHPADHEPPSVIAAPASTTTPRSLRRDEIAREPVDTLLALASTTVREVVVSIEPTLPSSSVDRPEAGDAEDDFEEAPVATAAVPKRVFRVRARIVRVTRPVYAAVGLLAPDDILDDE